MRVGATRVKPLSIDERSDGAERAHKVKDEGYSAQALQHAAKHTIFL